MDADAKTKMMESMKLSSNGYNAADTDRNSTLDFEEFCTLNANKGKDIGMLRELFDEADKDGNGCIDKNE